MRVLSAACARRLHRVGGALAVMRHVWCPAASQRNQDRSCALYGSGSASQVDYYGAISPLRTIAGISAPDAQSLVIQPYDISAMPNIEKAIQKSDLGITPSNDGKVIRINIPPLTAVRSSAARCCLKPSSLW